MIVSDLGQKVMLRSSSFLYVDLGRTSFDLCMTLNLFIEPALRFSFLSLHLTFDLCPSTTVATVGVTVGGFEWGFYAQLASKAIFRARTYNCITYSAR